MGQIMRIATSAPAGTERLAQFEVLVVEDDPICLEEYCELIEGLGYACRGAVDGVDALKVLATYPAIGIVVTDVDMPAMDGLTLLSELQARFTSFRPLVPLVVTGLATLETAVEAMRADASDFLVKPVTPQKLAVAMRRASARWAVLFGQFRLMAMLDAGRQLPPPETDEETAPAGTLPQPDKETLQRFVRMVVRARQRRSEFIDTSMFADPAWDILLDLTSAGLQGRVVPVSSACAAAQVPLSTALRHVKLLVAAGMIKRWDDPEDKRRQLLALEDATLEAMSKYLASVWTNQEASKSKQGGPVRANAPLA